MCTHYTLHYKCGHSQTSFRCPRSKVTHTDENGGTATYTHHCGDNFYLKGDLNDECIDCKMEKGLAPGQQTGFHVWAEEVKDSDVNGVDDVLRDAREVSAVESNAGTHEEEVRNRSASVASVDPRLLVRGSQGPGADRGGSADVFGIRNREDDFEAKLRAVFAPEQRATSSSTVDSGYTNYSPYGSTTFERQVSPSGTTGDGTNAGFGGYARVDEEVPVSIVDGVMDVGRRFRKSAPAKSVSNAEDAEDWMWGGTRGFGDEAT